MPVVKPKSVVILGVDLPLEPFIDSAYLQNMLDDLNTKEGDPKRFMHNARVIARYMEQDSLTLMLKNQETYFTGIAAEDKLFDYKNHPDFKRTTQVLTNIMVTRKVPDVIINALHCLY